jgi:PPP family 3-phenylpropionic acid transporter
MQTGFATRLAALYAALFVVLGIQLPFFPVWLKAKGLDAGTIGLVLAAPIVVRVFAITLAARAADRHDALRGAIMVASAASVVGYALVGLASGAAAILAAYMAASLAFTPLMPLSDAYALKGLAARGRAYGPVRLWGSAAFIAGTFIAGIATDVIAARELIWLIVAGYALNAVVALQLAPLPAGGAPPGETPAVRRSLLGDPAFLAGVAAASLIQASHAVYYGFSALAWRAAGFGGTSIAALWALGVLAEIVLFALQARLPAFLTPTALIMVGGAGGALRWAAMALDRTIRRLIWTLRLARLRGDGASGDRRRRCRLCSAAARARCGCVKRRVRGAGPHHSSARSGRPRGLPERSSCATGRRGG